MNFLRIRPSVFWLVILLVVVSIALARTASVYEQLALITDVRHEIVQAYVDEADEPKLVESAVRGMVQSLSDPYTTYLTGEELESLDEMVQDKFTGIGAEITLDKKTGHLKVITPLEDSPAWRAGVMSGDSIVEIEDVLVTEIFESLATSYLKLREAVKRLKGPEGTQVKIRVLHESGDEEDITITRALISVKGVRGFRRDADNRWIYILDVENRIGYVKVRQFTDRTADELRGALQEIEDEIRGLILDLRFNPGGLLTAAVDVSDIFLDSNQTIVSVEGRTVRKKVERAHSRDSFANVPMVVLANEASASAAEIVTGALTDNGRAKFVGMRTFGKGSVQQIRMLESGGALKLTTAYYYLPNGRLIHRREDSDTWGVDPDDGYFVPMSYRKMNKIYLKNKVLREHDGTQITPQWIEQELADLQLAAALSALLGKLENDEWPVVGRSSEEALSGETERASLRTQRDLLRDRLKEVEAALDELDVDEDEAPSDAAGEAEAEPQAVEEDEPVNAP